VFYLIPNDKIGVDPHPYIREARCMDCHGGSRLGEDETRRYAHLRPLERKRILQILVDTRTDLPAAFGEALKAGKPF